MVKFRFKWADLASQINRHSVALISLVVALISLGYNTWRNEVTEHNRNVRFAGFEVLLKLGELQKTVFLSHYDKDPQQGNPRLGWTYILVMQDVGDLMPAPIPQDIDHLHQTWQLHWSGLGNSQASVDEINAAIDRTRASVKTAMGQLD